MSDTPQYGGAKRSADENRLEMAVLATILSERFLLLKAIEEGFDPRLFRAAPARLLASLLMALRDEGVQFVDMLLLRSKLEERGQLTGEILAYLGELSGLPKQDTERLSVYLNHLRERSGREFIGQLGREMQRFAEEENPERKSVESFSQECMGELRKLQQARIRKRLAPLNEAVREVLEDSKGTPNANSMVLGYSLAPFTRLEHALSGLRRGFYYGLAGAPRRGKTNFALHIAAQVAANHEIPVLFYSWEQTRRVLSARLVGKESGVNPTELLSGRVGGDSETLDRLAKGLAGVQHYGRSLFLLEGSRQDTVERIRATAYNAMQDARADGVAIILDYLQKVPLGAPVTDPRARIDEISTGLADLSLELNCPVVVISAIDKEGCLLDDDPGGDADLAELLDRPRPTMHHCTGGGDIEYDLDVAMVLSKDWAATQQLAELLAAKAGENHTLAPKIDLLNLHIDKNRDAPQELSETIQYAFFVHQNRFVEVDFKRDEERQADFRGFARAQQIFDFLLAQGHLVQPATLEVAMNVHSAKERIR